MSVLVDTSVWSLALRRRPTPSEATVVELAQLIHESRVVMIGTIRQEILSGVRDRPTVERLRLHLGAFPDEPLTGEDYERAAECFNICRTKGVQGSNTDFLICAVAERRRLAIFTTDEDFSIYRKHLPIALHVVRGR